MRNYLLKAYLVLGLFVLFAPGNSFSQEQLTEQQLDDFAQKAKLKMLTLTGYLASIGNRETPVEIRDEYIELAVGLFRKGALMEVSNVNSGKKWTTPMLIYLQRIKRFKYDVVIIEYEAFRLTTFMKVRNPEDGSVRYVATATVTQKFCGKFRKADIAKRKEEECSYKDTTKKSIEVELRQVKDYFGKRWVVLFGDVTVNETKR